MKLSELKAVPGSRKDRKRVGRGIGSGTGKTSGRGHKGQKSRSGGNPHPWFEGGQMPLYRRLPKRGFTNIFKKEYEIVNLAQLAGLETKDPITPEFLRDKGVIRRVNLVKILGNGELSEAVTVHAQKFSRSAVEKIEKSGGKVVIL
ncbi:MAG: 50S ribosomal protein L15 [Nitrospina sp.]|jgi:large subunit ribosomal protein L15|nr:50S ribosomal protein L15 [Nitrospina sp.]